jgi:hypothetical protein
MNNALLFKQIFSPFISKHIYPKQTPSLFGHDASLDWHTAEQPLTDNKINRAIASKIVLGYFLSVSTCCFCLDIDDHRGKGDGYLLSVYQTCCNRLNSFPSLLRKTPHGLHAFYVLSHHVPEVLVLAQARQVLRNVPVEVKPTSAIGLRIPTEKDLLDPRTLNPLNMLFEDAVKAAPVYHPVHLFGMGILPPAIVEGLKERQAKTIKMRTWKSIARAEEDYGKYGIQPGATNRALCELIPVYRSAGLTPEGATAEFVALLAPKYDGELRNYRRLLQRVRSFYKNEPETRFNTLPEKAEIDLFTEIIAETIAGLVTGPAESRQQKAALTQRRRTAKKAVMLIESWKLYLNEVISRKEFLEMWDYLYPYFRKNTSEGYHPISRNIFKKKMHEHYESWLLPFLREIGYLERSPYKYSSAYGICYYYKINSFKFTGTELKPETKAPRIRNAKAKTRADQIRAYKREHPKATTRIIAFEFGISAMTVSRILRGV